MMKGLAFTAWIFFTGTPLAAAEDPTIGPADNPAFCFGFLSAQSPHSADTLARRKVWVRSRFAKTGPKDSTDERGFGDWEKIGRDAASERTDKRYSALLKKCRRLLGGRP